MAKKEEIEKPSISDFTDKFEITRKRLQEERGFPVTMFWFMDINENPLVGYLEEPSRELKERINDMYHLGQFSEAAKTLLQICLIPSESYDFLKENKSRDQYLDQYYMGALTEAEKLIKISFDLSKKK